MYFDIDEICGDYLDELPGKASGQLDPKPEYFQYRDEGCKRAKSCLDCPFTRCYYDRRSSKPRPRRRRSDNRLRNKEIKTLRWNGKTIKQLSRHFKVSRRTIARILNNSARGAGAEKEA